TVITQRWQILVLACELPQPAAFAADLDVLQAVSLLAGAADAENNNLLVACRVLLCQPAYRDLPEMGGQYLGAPADALRGDHHHKHPSGLQPAEAVLKKQALRSLVVALRALEVVRRVQEQKPVTLNRAMHVEAISLHYVIQGCPSFLCAETVQLDAMTEHLRGLRDDRQRLPCTSTRIESGCGCTWRKLKPGPNSTGFCHIQRKISEP